MPPIVTTSSLPSSPHRVMTAAELVIIFCEVNLSSPAFEQLLRNSGVGWEQFDGLDAHPILMDALTPPVAPSQLRCHPNDSRVCQHGELLSPRAAQPARRADAAHAGGHHRLVRGDPSHQPRNQRGGGLSAKVSTASSSPTPAR